MVAALHDDGAVPGEDSFQARQPSHLDCTIQVAKDEQCRYAPSLAQALFQVSQVIMALRGAPEQVMRVAAYRPVKVGSPVGLFFPLRKVLLRPFRHGFERVLQEKIEVVAQKTEDGRTHQPDHGIDAAITLKRPGEAGQDNDGAKPFGPACDYS
jgi:hypothetical protein